mmetsp:Transcript_2767/g.4182  ORF Transcript_2767/g.4182 Transcript_2767/m.4182 type:complete len:446 (+) Transcript_2767:116-1453(+)
MAKNSFQPYELLTPISSPREFEKSAQACLHDEEQKRRNKIIFAKTSIGVTIRESGNCRIEESVYGATILMPQLARTLSWDRTVTILVLRTWLFLILNCLLQLYLLTMLSKEENVMDLFSGQMNLCDFGAGVADCPGPGCTGPQGTEYSAGRMRPWGVLLNRNFVKDSFVAMFPERAKDIEHNVDPGEYGLESYMCRLFCCFVFMIPCMEELAGTYKMAQLLYWIPTENQPWVVARDDAENKFGGLDEVRLKIAGMSAVWKVVNLLTVILPKLVLWIMTAQTGMKFLMETAGIQNIIVNAVGLTFIANLDELALAVLMSEEARDIVASVEPFPLFHPKTSIIGNLDVLSDDEIVERYAQHQKWSNAGFKDFMDLIPFRLLISIGLTWIFNRHYYYSYCRHADTPPHRWISSDMFLPKSTAYTWLQALLPTMFPLDVHDEPFWQMPK